MWRRLSEPDEIAEALVDLYRRRGDATYDEILSQTNHARQTGAHAMAAGAGAQTIVAAFLHDIGHLLMTERDEDGEFIAVDRHHEEVGARFLSNWFGEDVLAPIRMHVAAKRFLCAVEDGYVDGLSDGSVRSLAAQGGPMSDAEVATFEAMEHVDLAIQVRRWDDLGKDPDMSTPTLETFQALIRQSLKRDAVIQP